MTTAQQQAYDAAIYQQATLQGIPQAVAQNIVAQARHESGDYTSDVFANTNNAYGYKYVSPNGSDLQIGVYNNYGVYNSIQDSTKEVVEWLQRHTDVNSLTTPTAYATAIKNAGYFGDTLSNYINGMTAAFSRINWQTVGVVAGGGIGLLLVVIGIIFLITKK